MPSPDADDALLALHAGVLFRTDALGALVGLNEPGVDPAPRVFVARGRAASVVLLGAGLGAATASACRAAVDALPPWNGLQPDPSLYEPLRRALATGEPIVAEVHGPAFRFGARVHLHVPDGVAVGPVGEDRAALLARHFPYTRSVLAERTPVIGAVVDGWIVSACYIARGTPEACEAGVATADAYRGRGLAPLVVAAWREAVEATGRRPLYSTSWDNGASLAVARRLSLVAFADTLALT